MNWGALAAGLFSAFLLWILFRGIKNNPNAFSKENMGKSFQTTGLLALFLIAVIAFFVLLLRS